jgi:hypothetical protein
MANKVANPEPGNAVTNRGIVTYGGVDKNQRKTGYRPDAKIVTIDNSIDPEGLIRRVGDSRLT